MRLRVEYQKLVRKHKYLLVASKYVLIGEHFQLQFSNVSKVRRVLFSTDSASMLIEKFSDSLRTLISCLFDVAERLYLINMRHSKER
jgi:hypothetical protein